MISTSQQMKTRRRPKFGSLIQS